MVKWIHIADVHLGASPDAGDAYSKVPAAGTVGYLCRK